MSYELESMVLRHEEELAKLKKTMNELTIPPFEPLAEYGWSIAQSFAAKRAYEAWSGEIITVEDMEYAIKGKNDRSGLFTQRISAFFAGYISNLNMNAI